MGILGEPFSAHQDKHIEGKLSHATLAQRALTLEAGGVPRAVAWTKLSRLPDLSGITRAEFDAVIDMRRALHLGGG